MKSISIVQRLHLQVPRVRQDQAGEGLVQGRTSTYKKEIELYLGFDRSIWLDNGDPAKAGHWIWFPAGYQISCQISGRIPVVCPNIRPDTGYLTKYPAGYRQSGQISDRIPAIWPNIRLDTGYLAKYPTGYRLSSQISYRISDIQPQLSRSLYKSYDNFLILFFG